jgi:outer membrane protein, multidrug efflux system
LLLRLVGGGGRQRFPLVFVCVGHELKNSYTHLSSSFFLQHVIVRMSFLRSYVLWLTVFQAGLGAGIASESVSSAASVSTALVEALPERRLPDLDALLSEGLAKGPTILMRHWEVEQSLQNARGARAPMLPTAYASLSGGRVLEQRSNEGQLPIEDRVLDAALYNVGISQPLFHWGALSKNYQVAKLYAAISARNLEETRRLLAVDLRRRYFDLVIARGAVVLEQKKVANLESELVLAKKRVDDGIAALTESTTIDYTLTQARISLQRLTNDYDLLVRNFSRLSGLPLQRIPVPVAELPPLPKLETLLEGLEGTQSGLPSVRLQNSEDIVRVDRLNYEINKTRLKPKLGLSFSVNQDNRNPDNDVLGPKALITSWNAFATVNWTLFDGFGAQAAQRSSLAKLRASETDRDLAVQQDRDERRADVAKLQLIWRQLQEAEKLLESAKGGVEFFEKEVAAGWAPRSAIDEARRTLDANLQSTNISRAEFYTQLASYFSNRGLDPALRSGAASR